MGGALIGDKSHCVASQVGDHHAKAVKESGRLTDGSFSKSADTIGLRVRGIQYLLCAMILFLGLNNACADSARLTNPDNGHTYQRFDTLLTWSQAKDSCASQNGHLATITSQAENDWVQDNFLAAAGIYSGNSKGFWLGGSDAEVEGQWTWITGEVWNFVSWSTGNPNNGGGSEQNYLCMWDFDGRGDWDDAYVFEDAPYLCEWGTITSPGSFVFSPIASPVEPNTCFPVQVEARTASGVRDTTVNGNVSLSANYGGVSPNVLSFTNGVASNSCAKMLETVGKNIQLTAQGAGLSGKSNFFDSTGSCTASVILLPTPHPDSPVTGILYDAAGVEVGRQVGSDDPQLNTYSVKFTNVPCGGSYRARLEKGSVFKDNINIEVTTKNVMRKVELPTPNTKGTPVILIPGIMGSSRSWQGEPPLLKGVYPDTGGLQFHHDLVTGWDALEYYLESGGYTVFRCPWDWRNGIGTKGNDPVTMLNNINTFLIPVIDEALTYSTTGKVHIVAHSMGGLMAREYMQRTYYSSRNDVEKLALVGVPNLGSANPYFLWEAGDISTTTKIIDNNDSNDGMYGNTIQKMWEKTYDNGDWHKCNAKAIRSFIQEKSPSLRQLMYTDTFLTSKDVAQSGVSAAGYENVWLKELNGGKAGVFNAPGDVFSIDGVGDKVQTRLFLGNTAGSTLGFIEVGSKNYKYPDGTTYYPDGKPLDVGPMSCSAVEQKKEATNSHIMRVDGDGTVPIKSAKYPMTAGWADREEYIGTESHAFMIKDFSLKILGFLDGTRAGVTTEPVAKDAMQKAVAKEAAGLGDTQLAFSVIGEAGILVTDSQGRRSGVTPDTHEIVNEIPGADIAIDEMVASVGIKNAVAGQYRLTYYGLGERELSLDISATDSTGDMQSESFEGFKPEAPQTMTVVYDAAASDHLVVQPVVAAPQELEAEPYTCGTGKCVRLKWKASTGAGVTQNVVYRALVNTPFYAEHTRLPAATLSYDTGEPWDTVNEIPINGYAVSAIKADSVESFFAEDKDSEYVFPWPMFLPAVTHGSQRP